MFAQERNKWAYKGNAIDLLKLEGGTQVTFIENRIKYITKRNKDGDASVYPVVTATTHETQDISATRCLGNFWPQVEIPFSAAVINHFYCFGL